MGKGMDEIKGKLYIVPTPIGNMGDITLRAIEVLKNCDLVLAEDTRVTGKLLSLLGLKKETLSMHKFNEHSRLEYVKNLLQEGKTIAYCSDAGTPGISDPGFLIVRECNRNVIPLEVLPGATAFIPALVASGLATERFVFEGFLPQKKGRQTRMKELALETRTMIFYESPFRLVKSLTELGQYLGTDRKACVSREITKLFEENRRGTLTELAAHYTKNPPKGEIVVVVEGNLT
jgi:16S rRNA (cytidine1402-2'-O)-methyltransferase